MRGNIICLLALYGCIPMVLYLFSKYKPEHAAIIAFFGALMFLPMAKLDIPLILYNKMTATAIGAILAIQVFDPEKLENLSLQLTDIPMIMWIASGFFASVTNGLGAKDGLQESFNSFTIWGIPYLVGRIYFSNAEGIKLLCHAIFIGGLLYIPFVWFELKMSPQTHAIVYGYMQHSFAQVMRGDGYRPMVFMEHGIMLGTWMCMAALVGMWCTYTRVFAKKVRRIPTIWLVAILLVTAVACKSSGATGLCIMGISALVFTARLKLTIVIWLMLLIPSAYIGTRATGYWDGQNLCNTIADTFSADRAASLQFRFDNENILVEKALQRPLFGWGGWGRSRVYDDETGEDVSVTDGFWIIALGTRGYFGLFSITLAMILPMLLFVINCPAKLWGKPGFAPTAVICIIPLLFMIDCMLNSMVNQAYIIFAGAATGMLASHGIKKLEGQAASDADRKNSADAGYPQANRQRVDPVAVRFHKTRHGGLSADVGIRPIVNPDQTAHAASRHIRMGLAPLNEEDGAKMLPLLSIRQTHPSRPSEKQDNASRNASTGAKKYHVIRNLTHTAPGKTRHISRRLAVREQETDSFEHDDRHLPNDQDKDYVYTEERWVRRL